MTMTHYSTPLAPATVRRATAGRAPCTHLLAALFASAAAALPAVAAPDTGELASSLPRWQINGFGTLGALHDGSDRYGFRRVINQPVSPRRTTQWTTDSRFGLQLSGQFAPSLRVAMQLLWRHQHAYQARDLINWGFVGYAPAAGWELRAGRVPLDLFMTLDYRNVGHAQLTARPAIEYYGWLTTDSVDGLDLTYRQAGGDNSYWQLRGSYGSSITRARFGGTQNVVTDHSLTITLRHERGPWMWQIAASQAQVHLNSDLGGLRQLAQAGIPGLSGPINESLDKLDTDDVDIQYVVLGTRRDGLDWLIEAEGGALWTDRRPLVSGKFGRLLAGRHIGALTPYVELSFFRPHHAPYEVGGNWSLLGPVGPVQQAMLNQGINSARTDQRSLSLGVRWDVRPDAALKLQFTRSLAAAHGGGLWDRADDVSHKRIGANLISVSLDVVF